jgi:hypothetical protein
MLTFSSLGGHGLRRRKPRLEQTQEACGAALEGLQGNDMVTWRFTGYYRKRCERAQRWNWRCNVNGRTKIISIRMFASFADCVRDAERHGYQHGEHGSEFDRRIDVNAIQSVAHSSRP